MDSITLQLTRITTVLGSSTIMDMSYGFTAGQNSVNHQFDRLGFGRDGQLHLRQPEPPGRGPGDQRLGNSYAYDGFGNLTAKTVTVGSAPTFSAAYDPGTNRQWGLSYDANGNVQLSGARYDVENRLTSQPAATLPSWAYDPSGKRVLQGPACCSNGSKLGTLWPERTAPGNLPIGLRCRLQYVVSVLLLHGPLFGGKLIKSGSAQSAVATDRLGSVRANANGQRIRYFPYGEERTTTPDGRRSSGPTSGTRERAWIMPINATIAGRRAGSRHRTQPQE